MTFAQDRIPTIVCVAAAVRALGKSELRRRAVAIRQQQLDLGWGGEFLNAISMELAAREFYDSRKHRH